MTRPRLPAILALALVASTVLFTGDLAAQDMEATLEVASTATVEVAPDHARLSVGVRIQASSPEEAATEMSARIEAIVDTLVAMGFDRDSLPTQVFGIQADRDFSGGNLITGYSASTTLQLTTFELGRIAEFVSAAIAKGATDVGNVDFGSTEEEAARSRALEDAVASARAEAEVLARAAGVELGPLLEITNTPPSGGIMLRSATIEAVDFAMSSSAITPQMLPVRAQVVVRWRLRPPPR